MNLTTIIHPEFEPVSLADVWEHLRLTPSGSPLEHPDDDMLTRHIATARREVEQMTNRALVRQKVRLSTTCWRGGIKLLRPPLISVEAVQYYDTANALQSVDPEDWYITDDLIPRLVFVDTFFPTTYQRSDAVRVDYWVGYPADGSPGTSREELIANVPSEAKDAILIGVELLHAALTPADRESLERARKSLLSGLTIQGMA